MWDGGPVNNLGQVLHRCPALGGDEVVPAAQGSSPADGPLIVGDHPLLAWSNIDQDLRQDVSWCMSFSASSATSLTPLYVNDPVRRW